MAADHEVGGTFVWAEAAAFEVDSPAPTYETAVPRQAYPSVLSSGTPPRAAAVADADLIEDLVVVVDKRPVERVIGVESATGQLQLAFSVEREAVHIDRWIEETLDDIDQAPLWSLARK